MQARPSLRQRQGGMFLIEALVAIVLFAIGILGMVGLSAYAIAAQSDAQYRSEAAAIASQIAQEAWLGVDRVSGASPAARATALANSLSGFKYQTGGESCAFSGDAATDPKVALWALEAQKLPGATAAMQQIKVDTDVATGFNKLTVTVCWKVPSDPVARKHTLATFVN